MALDFYIVLLKLFAIFESIKYKHDKNQGKRR